MSLHTSYTFEREKILFFLAEGKSITEIAHLLKRSKSTISRELRRNAAPACQPMSYCPLTAQTLYKQRRKACRPHKRLEYAPLHSYIQICILEYHWSPEEIVGRIQEDYIQRKYHELHLRPRKCLGYKTPYEVYFSKVLHLA